MLNYSPATFNTKLAISRIPMTAIATNNMIWDGIRRLRQSITNIAGTNLGFCISLCNRLRSLPWSYGNGYFRYLILLSKMFHQHSVIENVTPTHFFHQQAFGSIIEKASIIPGNTTFTVKNLA